MKEIQGKSTLVGAVAGEFFLFQKHFYGMISDIKIVKLFTILYNTMVDAKKAVVFLQCWEVDKQVAVF